MPDQAPPPDRPPCVLSIQSEVVSGHVGNSAARFVLQRLGLDVLALPTVLLAHHPGHGPPAGRTTPPAELRALLEGIDRLGALARTQAVLSGYLGDPAQAEIVAEAVARLKARPAPGIYLLDPVFGDDDGAFGRPGVAEAMARTLLPLADIVTPNRFELQALSGRPVRDRATAVAAARSLGRPCVIATSVPDGADRLLTLAVTRDTLAEAAVQRQPGAPHGTGDVLAALYLGHRLTGADMEQALHRAVGGVDGLVRAAVQARLTELPLIAGQQAWSTAQAP